MKNIITKNYELLIAKALLLTWLVIMALLPFHAFISTWGGTALGPLAVWKAWKDILIILLALLSAILVVTNRSLRRTIATRLINKVIVIYGLWQVIVTVVSTADLDARLLGLAMNLRFLAMFVVAQIMAFYFATMLQKRYKKLLLIPFILVVGFGLLQLFLLPKNFLSHFGYDKNTTIAPYLTIDSQPDTLRIASFQRGPNQLGAYLILPILTIISFIYFRKRNLIKDDRKTLTSCFLLIASLVVLYGTHSRSAILAMLAAFGSWLLLILNKKWRKIFLTASFLITALVVLVILQFKHTGFVQTVIFHDKQDYGPVTTSNSAHKDAYKFAVNDIEKRPVYGCGSGCAGPASYYNNKPAKISENYYLQVAQESGLIGLTTFIAILILLAKQLYRQSSEHWSKILLASLVGLSISNMFLHIWADETVAIVWWGFAGLIYLDQPKTKRKIKAKT